MLDAKLQEELNDAIVNETIYHGRVKELRQYKETPGSKTNTDLVVDMNGFYVIIPEDFTVLPLGAYAQLSLVGEDVKFVISEVYADDDLVFGSMKRADEIKKAPVMKKLLNRETLVGTFITFTSAGAYIDLGAGVQGFMYNSEYSNSVTLAQAFRKYMEISVFYKETSIDGTIMLIPVKKDNTYEEDVKPIVRGDIYKGRISGIGADRVFVTVRPKTDCLCEYPTHLGKVKKNESVSVKIIKADNGKLRGKVLNRIDD